MSEKMLDLDALEAIAKSATPGPWTCDKPPKDADGWAHGVTIASTYGRQLIYADPPGGQSPAADQRFIAAFNPVTALALIAAARERKSREMTHGRDCHLWGRAHYECLLAKFDDLATDNARLRQEMRRVIGEREEARKVLRQAREVLKAADDALEDLRVPANAGPNRFEEPIPGVLAMVRAAHVAIDEALK